MDDEVDINVRYDHRLASVKTEVEFNWSAIGEHFVRAKSDDQAALLLGWDAEADALGFLNEDRQYMYISDAIASERVRHNIADRLHRLAEALEAER